MVWLSMLLLVFLQLERSEGDTCVRRGFYDHCCGDVTYHFEKQACCKGRLHNETNGHCCGQDFIRGSDHSRIYLCCNHQVRKVASAGHSQCCGTEVIDLRYEKCCYNYNTKQCNIPYSLKIYKGLQLRTELCCDTEFLNRTEYFCCNHTKARHKLGGSVFLLGWKLRCCGNTMYYMDEQKCCKGVLGYAKIKPLQSPRFQFQCCGTETYDRDTHMCCSPYYAPQNVVPRTRGWKTKCCRDKKAGRWIAC